MAAWIIGIGKLLLILIGGCAGSVIIGYPILKLGIFMDNHHWKNAAPVLGMIGGLAGLVIGIAVTMTILGIGLQIKGNPLREP